MIHRIDQPVTRPTPALSRTHSSEGQHRISRQPSHDDEIHFSGLPGRSHSRGSVQPRAPPKPQQQPYVIGGGEVDETPILARDGGNSDFNEESVRYTGSNIP